MFNWFSISGAPSGTVSHIQMCAVHLYATGVLFVLHSLPHTYYVKHFLVFGLTFSCWVPIPLSALHIGQLLLFLFLFIDLILIQWRLPCIRLTTLVCINYSIHFRTTLSFIFPCTHCLPTCHTSHTHFLYFLCCSSIHILFCWEYQLPCLIAACYVQPALSTMFFLIPFSVSFLSVL